MVRLSRNDRRKRGSWLASDRLRKWDKRRESRYDDAEFWRGRHGELGARDHANENAGNGGRRDDVGGSRLSNLVLKW